MGKPEIIKDTTPVENDKEQYLQGEDAKYLLVALTLCVARQPMLSGDSKFFIFHGIKPTLINLGVKEEEAERMSKIMEEIRKKFQTSNDFMG